MTNKPSKLAADKPVVSKNIVSPERDEALKLAAHARGMTLPDYIMWCVNNWEAYIASQDQADERRRVGL